ncbi:prepilin-type N-terminal cleavage/methylation domain-containing protein [Patescibacteria group bacterium]|nr:MAG: prepilin-type N-terminal cleavage/methylation domain-containing protein [Patescibacteria group bacterium]
MSLLRNRQSGYSLLELVITMAIIAILVTSLVNVTIGSARGYRYLQTQSDASVDLSNTLNRVAKVVRGSTSVTEAQSNRLTVFAYFSPQDTVVKQITYFVDGSDLKATVIPPSGSGPNYTYNAADGKTYTLARNLNGGGMVFSYFNDTGAQLSGSFTTTQIKQVGITVIINPNPKVLRKPMSAQTIVTLRNKKTNL